MLPVDEIVAGISTMEPAALQQVLCTIAARFPGSIEQFKLRAEEEDADKKENPIRIMQVGKFLADLGDPPPMLIQGFLPQNSLFLLSGKPKHLKSFVALDVADAVSTGRPIFGEYTVNQPGPVIYFAMEDGEYEIANRLLSRGIRKNDERPLYVCPDRFTLNTKESVAKLRELVAEFKPSLIIIDTATEALGIRKWEDRGEVSDAFRPLRDFAREVCSVIVVTHNRKAEGDNGDEIAGTNAVAGSVDGWWSIYAKQLLGNGNVQLSGRREGRGSVKGEFIIEMDTHTLHMRALSHEEVSSARKRDEEAAAAETLFHKHVEIGAVIMTRCGNRVTPAELSAAMDVDIQKGRTIVKDMLAAGYIVATDDKRPGTGTGRPPTVYAVSETFAVTLASASALPSPVPPKEVVMGARPACLNGFFDDAPPAELPDEGGWK